MNIIKFIIEYRIKINDKDFFNRTPLYIACLNGNEVVVKYLVEHGTDVNKEESNETLMFSAY